MNICINENVTDALVLWGQPWPVWWKWSVAMLRSKRVWDEAFLIVTLQIMSPYELWEMNTDVCKWVNYLKSPFGRTSWEHERPTSPTSLWRATRFSLSTNATMLGALGRLVVCTSTSSLFRLSFEFVWCIVHVLVPLCFCPYVPQRLVLHCQRTVCWYRCS